MYEFWSGYVFGFLCGMGFEKNFPAIYARVTRLFESRSLRPVNVAEETKVFAATIGASIEPEYIPNMWRSRMRAFVFHAEQCHTPCNARDLKKRIGLSRPRQMEYIRLLIDANLVYIRKRGKGEWLTDWKTRHKAIALLPYPRNVEPPDFRTLAPETVGTDRTQNRRKKTGDTA
jgi:hypothetical protein